MILTARIGDQMRIFFFIACFCLLFFPGQTSANEGYVGSQQCASCHPEIYRFWKEGGHHNQLRSISGEGPADLVPPQGYSWDDISYVVGGFKVKAHFVDSQGYLVTSAKDGSHALTEYDLVNRKWMPFFVGEKKPYDCGPCHTTGYSPEGHQGGLPGVVGTWQEDGIGCETCHGPGLKHSKDPQKRTSRKARSEALCEGCHQRGGIDQKPLIDLGLVRHHEQINELKAGAHKGLECLNCHKPHATAEGTKYNCTICHSRAYNGYEQSVHGQAEIKCIECHMAKIPKAAISRTSYVGRVRSHLFSIEVNEPSGMFRDIEEKGRKSTFTKNFIAVEYACLQCHEDRDRSWAISHSRDFHERHKTP